MVAPLSWVKATYDYLQGCQLQKVWDTYPKELAPILIHGSGNHEYPRLWDCTHRKVTSGLHCHSCNPTRTKNHWQEIMSYTSSNQAEVCRIRSDFMPSSQHWAQVGRAWEIRATQEGPRCTSISGETCSSEGQMAKTVLCWPLRKSWL